MNWRKGLKGFEPTQSSSGGGGRYGMRRSSRTLNFNSPSLSKSSKFQAPSASPFQPSNSIPMQNSIHLYLPLPSTSIASSVGRIVPLVELIKNFAKLDKSSSEPAIEEPKNDFFATLFVFPK